MSTTRTQTFETERQERMGESEWTALALLWSLEEPGRVGEVVQLPDGRSLLGRAAPDPGASPPILGLQRARPGRTEPTGGLGSPHVSRIQWEMTPQADGSVVIANRGRAPLRIEGRKVDEGVAQPGDLVEMAGLALFRVTTRTTRESGGARLALHPFGGPDADGIVGETPAAWALRERLAFVAARDVHVLVLGPSGAGKELVARAVHRRSSRPGGPFVTRNAATIPETLVDAELFGNARNYPNAGMPERAGLVGDADGGTLFLDELGELPVPLQTHLLRVLDSGEYTRLGEARARRAAFRLVGATNRPPEILRDDVRARLPLAIRIPPLGERVDDVPLLARHVLRRIHANDPAAVDQFFDPAGAPRLSVRLVDHLVRQPWHLNVRELEAVLWDAIAQSPGPTLDIPVERAPAPPPAKHATAPADLTAAELQDALDRHGGNQEETWRALGLASRHVLTRLVRRHNLRVRGRDGKGGVPT